jgi:hypothetical protein
VELRGLDHCDYHKFVSAVLSCFSVTNIFLLDRHVPDLFWSAGAAVTTLICMYEFRSFVVLLVYMLTSFSWAMDNIDLCHFLVKKHLSHERLQEQPLKAAPFLQTGQIRFSISLRGTTQKNSGKGKRCKAPALTMMHDPGWHAQASHLPGPHHQVRPWQEGYSIRNKQGEPIMCSGWVYLSLGIC